MKRTPGPWGWADISDNNKDPRIVIAKIPIPEDAKNCVIARIKNEVSGKPLTEEDKANAAFIVHACNLHDELVEALKRALAWGEGEIHNEYDGTSSLQSRLEELDFIRRCDAVSTAQKGSPITKPLPPEVGRKLTEKAASIIEVKHLNEMEAEMVTAALFMGAGIAMEERGHGLQAAAEKESL